MNKCLECNNITGFVTSKKGYIFKSRPRIFCNKTCHQKYRRKNTIKIINCAFCNIAFEKWNHKTKHSRKFCSKKCSGTVTFHKILNFSGEKKKRRYYKKIKVGNKYMDEHRFIMQQHVGRNLERFEHVHHINGKPQDNRLENLQLLTNSNHQKEEHKERKKLFLLFLLRHRLSTLTSL